MTLIQSLLSASLAAVLFAPLHARACDHDLDGIDDVHVDVSVQADVQPAGWGAPVGVPPGTPQRHGRYELRTVQRWVPGHFEKVWVPEVCSQHGWRGRVKCRPGFFDKRWVAGRMESVQQWVWVPNAHRPYPHRGHGHHGYQGFQAAPSDDASADEQASVGSAQPTVHVAWQVR